MNDSIFCAEKNHVNPLEPTAWPTARSHGPISQRPHISIALFYLLYGLPETSLFPASNTVEVIRGEWVESLANRPTEIGAVHLPFRIPYYLRVRLTYHRFSLLWLLGYGHPAW
jgi:hypothetical protein